MATYNAVVLESIVETHDTKTLVLDIGTAPSYVAGQYVTIDPHQYPGLTSIVGYLEHAKGRREVPRAYSMCSAPSERHIAITIKEEPYEAGRTEYPPLLSGYLVHQVRAGDPMVVRGFAGIYTLPDAAAARANHILHLCAGSGSVPNVSILKDSLERHPNLRHTFLYSNRTRQDIIFRGELDRLQAQYPSRLRVAHMLTRDPDPLPDGLTRGRITPEQLIEAEAAEPGTLIYVCGPAITVWERRACAAQGTSPPPRFIEAMLDHLDGIGVPRTRVKLEAFG
jgi:ferredoxin-NADP reductase